MSDRQTHAEMVRSIKDSFQQDAVHRLQEQLEHFYVTEDSMKAAHIEMQDFVSDYVQREWTAYWETNPRVAAAQRMRDEIARDLNAFLGLNMPGLV